MEEIIFHRERHLDNFSVVRLYRKHSPSARWGLRPQAPNKLGSWLNAGPLKDLRK
ncbi:hypothetical protein J6590_054809 [Homalodisca vitripennis]|nr:hypothetical protein J6590_054809 [Homalodisca vitripennis]